MPWRMIFFLFILLVLVVFIAFNVDHSSDISFGIRTFEDVPIFVSLFIAFTAGVVLTIPMVLISGKKKPPRENRYETEHAAGNAGNAGNAGKSKRNKGKKGKEDPMDIPRDDIEPPLT